VVYSMCGNVSVWAICAKEAVRRFVVCDTPPSQKDDCPHAFAYEHVVETLSLLLLLLLSQRG
jgi:hypothetical protein